MQQPILVIAMDILDTLKSAVADKDGTQPVQLSAEDVYEVIGELAYLRQRVEKRVDANDSNQIVKTASSE